MCIFNLCAYHFDKKLCIIFKLLSFVKLTMYFINTSKLSKECTFLSH